MSVRAKSPISKSQIKPTFRSYFPEKGVKIQNPYWEMILGNYHTKITIFLLLIRMH